MDSLMQMARLGIAAAAPIALILAGHLLVRDRRDERCHRREANEFMVEQFEKHFSSITTNLTRAPVAQDETISALRRLREVRG